MTERARLGVACIGGGSGGHIFPGLAVIETIADTEPSMRAVFITGDRAVDEAVLEPEPWDRVALGARPPARKPRAMLACITSWGQAVRDTRTALRTLKDSCEHVVAMSTGGYVSAPAAQAARAERVPLVLVALDARVGKANRFVSRRARQRLMAQDQAPAGWQAIGPIVGKRALAPADPGTCRKRLGLDANTPCLLVVGGSQGARSINQLIMHRLEHAPEIFRGWQLLHLAGDAEGAHAVEAALQQSAVPGVALPSLNPIGPAWGAADLAVCRAGAGTAAEVHANAVPAIFLPYPYHRDAHQASNVRPLVEAGGAIVVEDAVEPRANASRAGAALKELLGSPNRRSQMAAALQALPRRDGAEACATALLQCAGIR
ncbi:MAG: UDP-N-acetylglucosamine--N-acetylmuramyl-(pentapeptide) pyrophosphoryl-undecaprenol N-acetylglucosamine transferase [Phycisphaerales bacterium]